MDRAELKPGGKVFPWRGSDAGLRREFAEVNATRCYRNPVLGRQLAMSRHCSLSGPACALLKIIFDKRWQRRYRTDSSNENDYQKGD